MSDTDISRTCGQQVEQNRNVQNDPPVAGIVPKRADALGPAPVTTHSAAIASALHKRDWTGLEANIAASLGVESAQIHRAMSLRHGRLVTAIAWKSGLDAQDAWRLQTQAALIEPILAIAARSDGSYALSAAEMEWQVSFLRTIPTC